MFPYFFLFELKLRFRQISTYVFFALFFFFAMFSVTAQDFGPIGAGKVYLNGPYALAQYLVQLGAFGMIILAAIFGTSILRDFQRNTFQLVFTKPIGKFAYLGGRWAGSMAAATFVFSGMVLGTIAGTLAPWSDSSRLTHIQPWWYVGQFLSISVINIFFLGSLFFLVAALTRRLFIVYLQGVVLFAFYLIAFVVVINRNALDYFWAAVFDPLGLIWIRNITRYWTVSERNTLAIPWQGVFLYNRLFWFGVGLVSLISTFVFFPMSAEALAEKSGGKRAARRRQLQNAEEEEPVRHRTPMALRQVKQVFNGRTVWQQLVSLTKLRFGNIVHEIPFWAILVIMVVLVVLNGHDAGRTADSAVWPVTYQMVAIISGSANLFLYIIATLYGGELIWRERDVQFDGIHDALPVPGWVNFVSQFVSLALLEAILLAVVIVFGVLMQAVAGYYNFELPVYLKELYLIQLPELLAFILLALFLHTLIPNKFAAHAGVIGILLSVPILYRYGIENRLILFGEVPPYTYSDMNGYGHFIPGVAMMILYWLLFGVILGFFTVTLARQGSDTSWKSRLAEAKQRIRPLIAPLALVVIAFIATGAWYYYNGHILNEFRTAKYGRRLQAQYEKDYSKYKKLNQPKVTAVETYVDIVPEKRSFHATGQYVLVNESTEPISEIHVSNLRESVSAIRFDRPAQRTFQDKRGVYAIYRLGEPLAPHQSIKMDFESKYQAKGFRDGGERAEMAFNGTFFDRDYFPSIGYDRNAELDNPVYRKEENLPPLEELAPRGDAYYSNLNLFVPDSDWITYKAVVGTSPDQIAVAPGYLKREWIQNGRRYFEYDMGDAKINNFYSFISGRYAVKRDEWKGVKLEIYYHPGHPYNLDRMLEAAKKGLDYFGTNFSPYQFTQFRVLEFPRYRTFAQSFPNTVPYSEELGFIQRVQKEEDLDMVFYITAHELAHQWWGHQLVGSLTEGSNMMSETLAQYSALMIMEKEYGPNRMRRFLRHELDAYLRGRAGEVRREPPLVLVQNEPYVWYRKGSLVMYALRDYIGEDKVNTALRNFLMARRYSTPPFPDTRDLVAALRAQAPPEMQSIITDMFESIVLFDNKVETATWTEMADHKYKVTIHAKARKVKADGQGVETEMPINDLVDVGVFSGEKDKETPLFLEKRRITGNSPTFEVVVNQKPTRAGIDPYNKLIDRNPGDNMVDVSRQ